MVVSVPPAELGRASSPGRSNGHADTKTWITLSGGTLGVKYTIPNTIQIASGMTDARSYQSSIQAQ